MKPIVITNPVSLLNELQIIKQLFDKELELLHVRKPDYSETEFRSLLTGIDLKSNEKLVLHQFHSMAKEFGISRLHFTSQKRRETTNWNNYSDFILSTSVHSIEEFNELPDCFEYVFLSPVFPSISKECYISEKNLLDEIKKRTNFQMKLIALGGITYENKQLAINSGFDGVAMLGSIWKKEDGQEERLNFK